jgi:hypothetical protein
MKQPLINIVKLQVDTYVQKTRFINRFIRLWGTQTINGIEVLNARNYYLKRSWEAFNDYPPFVPAAGKDCVPKTERKCEQIIVGFEDFTPNEYGNFVAGAPKYEEQCTTVYTNSKTETVHRRPPICTRERRLVEHINFWKQAKAQDTKGVHQMWLYLNPAKLLDFCKDKNKTAITDTIKKNLEKYLYDKADLQGRITFKANIIASNEFIPGLNEQAYEEKQLEITNYSTSEILEEDVWITETIQVDGKDTVVKKVFPIFTTNADGTAIQTGTEFKKIKENVTSYTVAKTAIQGQKDYIWAHNLVTSPSDDMYEEMLGRYLLVHGDPAKVRLEYVVKSNIQYTREETYNEPIWGAYKDFLNGVTVNYKGINSSTEGDRYEATYNIPVYTITIVVKDYIKLATLTVAKIKEDIFNDFYKTVCMDHENNIYQCSAGTYGSTITAITYGRINAYSSYKSIRRIYQESDDPAIVTRVAAYTSMFLGAGGHAPGGIYVGHNADWWVLSPGYGHAKSNLPWLKVDVLKGKLGNLSLKDRINLVSTIIDAGWWEESSSVGILSVAIIVIAVAVAVYAPQWAGVVTKAAAMATSMLAFSMVISLGSALLSANNNYTEAKWLVEINRTIAPAVQIASIVIVVNTAAKWIQYTAQVAEQAVAKTATEIAEDFVKNVITKMETVGPNQMLEYGSKMIKLHTDNDISNITRENENKQKELQDLMQANEESKYSDVYKKFASAMANPLQLQGSSFEFDRQFEQVLGDMHIGNICRTSVLALMGDGSKTYLNNLV